MAQEENITQELIKKFAYLEGKIRIQRQRRVSLEVNLVNFWEVFEYAVRQMQFAHLTTITGLDEGENLSFIYHLAGDSGIVLSIKTSVPKVNPVLRSVTPFFPGADIYERELVDLLGAKVEGLTSGNRYPLTDDWPADQYPLRKDWRQNA